MQFRFVRKGDLPAIIALEHENFSAEERIEDQVLAYYVEKQSQTCFVMENDSQELVGYLLSLPTSENRVTDQIFYQLEENSGAKPYLAIASLSVASSYKGQGIGTLLLSGLKELVETSRYLGISLTCKDYLLTYYKENGFEYCGISSSRFANQIWHDMYWKSP